MLFFVRIWNCICGLRVLYVFVDGVLFLLFFVCTSLVYMVPSDGLFWFIMVVMKSSSVGASIWNMWSMWSWLLSVMLVELLFIDELFEELFVMCLDDVWCLCVLFEYLSR